MTWRTCSIVVALLLLFLTVPALGKNYSLHSPKLWTPQEKEQYEKENPPVISEKIIAEKQKEQVKKDKEQAEKQKDLVKKEKEQFEKEKERLKKEKEKARIKKNQIMVKDGVSYREVTAQNGDTIYTISRKYSKEGSSYAETLRFNNIQDPDQIVIGDIIKVPLFQEKKAKQSTTAKRLKLTTADPKKRASAKIANKTVPSHVKQSNNGKNELPVKAILSSSQLPTALSASVCVTQQQTFTNNSTAGPKLFEQAIKSYRNGDCQTAIQLFGRFLAEQNASTLAADASLFIADCYLKLSGK